MRYNPLGDSDLLVSELCLGTMTYGQQNTLEEAHQQLDMAWDQGINFFDTAEMYPVPTQAETQGLSEVYLGKWLSGKQRDQIIVASKLVAPGRGLEWIRGGDHAITERNIKRAVEDSLSRLQTDYIDLYQIHWPDRYVPLFGQTGYDPEKDRTTVPIEEQLRGFEAEIRSGKIRYLGLSNETPWGLYQFVRIAHRYGLPNVISVQNAYNLLNRVFDLDLAEICHREKIGLLAYSPLAFGLLTGKYLNQDSAWGRLSLFQGFGGRYYKPNVDKAVREYVDLAQRYNLTPAQLALTFVRSNRSVTSMIIGASRTEQLSQNISAIEIELDDRIWQEIESIHARLPNPAP